MDGVTTVCVGQKLTFVNSSYGLFRAQRNAEDKFHDNRIDLLKKDYFEGKRCLDIGCNIGLVSIAIGMLTICIYIMAIHPFDFFCI